MERVRVNGVMEWVRINGVKWGLMEVGVKRESGNNGW